MMSCPQDALYTSFICALNFSICIIHIFKILDLPMVAFICILSIAFCVDKFQPCSLVNRQNNVFSLHKFMLFPQVSDIGSVLRIQEMYCGYKKCIADIGNVLRI